MTDRKLEPLVYPDGDTQIAFPWGVYQLHSTILSPSSKYLSGLFRWPGSSTNPPVSEHGSLKWTLVLGEEELLTQVSDEYPLPKIEVRKHSITRPLAIHG